MGLLDIDICGPSVPKLTGLEAEEIHRSAAGWSPVYVEDNLAVMSIGFLLPNPDDAVIWRGPRKNGLIKQFLKVTHRQLARNARAWPPHTPKVGWVILKNYFSLAFTQETLRLFVRCAAGKVQRKDAPNANIKADRMPVDGVARTCTGGSWTT